MVALCLLAVGTAAGQGDVITAPDWLRKPTQDELLSVWPMNIDTGGTGSLQCVVTVQGTLKDCTVVGEEPEGSGFGKAALTLTPQFFFKPSTRNGEPRETSIRFTVNFECPGGGCKIRGPSHPVLANVPWIKAPTVEDVRSAYPKRAREQQLNGLVALSCRFGADGQLTSCRSLTENPRGQGFSAAALTLAKKFEGPTAFDDGKPTDRAYVQLTIAFDKRVLDGRAIIGKPRWVRLPSQERLEAALPPDLEAKGENGEAILRCRVADSGDVTGCVVTREEPAGSGMAAAALALSSDFRLQTWTEEGLPVIGGEVGIPIRFKFKDEAAD